MRKWACLAAIIVFSQLISMHINGNSITVSAEQTVPVTFQITFERMFIDGEMSEETVIESFSSLQDVWDKYTQWELIEKRGNNLIFRQYVNDISPLLKANGFFGITNDGVLTIFNGKPNHAKVIHSFFQIDLNKLESSKRQLLQEGIPIKTKDQYVEVLASFKELSVKDKEKK